MPTNIVEGFKRRTTKEYMHFVNIADASLEETRYLLLLARDLGYFKEDEYAKVIADYEDVGKMIGGLGKSLSGKL